MIQQQSIGVKALIVNDQQKVLLIKRSEKYDYLKDAWDIPGGRINFAEDPGQGLQREIEEETGLQLKEIKRILDVSTVFKDNEKHIVRITYLCSVKEGNIKLSDEHTQCQWFSKDVVKALHFKDELLKRVIKKLLEL